MSDLDSRQLRAFDSFGQKFSKPGAHKYGLGTPGGPLQFTIDVVNSGGAANPTTHVVTVSYAAGQFRPDQDPLKIGVGDVVVWKDPKADDPPYAVVGSGPTGDFGNGKMAHESFYTHTFIASRTYDWRDAHGGGMKGSVKVNSVDVKNPSDYNAWLESIKTGPVIQIDGTKLANGDVVIPIGGTVCWTVQNAAGIALVDALLPLTNVGPGHSRSGSL